MRISAFWQRYRHLGIVSALGISGAIALCNYTLAQNITLDGTLGPAGTLTGPRYVIPQEVGQTVENNLFHSFGQFGLLLGERVGFASAANIRNILVRVTGGSPSLIDGLIYTDSANVNLFLINPSGIQLGSNAGLDVGGRNRGSFVATTVDALVWPNGGQFSATNPSGANSLLTITGDPGGFLSQSRAPAPLVSSGNALGVVRGQSLLLLGGNVNVEGGVLVAPGGRVELGGLSEPGTVQLNADGNNLSLSFPNNIARADVSLTNGSLVAVSGGGGGSIAVNARNLTISGESGLIAGIRSGLGAIDAKAGNIEINATDTVTIDGTSSTNFPSVIINTAQGAGSSGDIVINTGSLNLIGLAVITAVTTGQGNAGNVTIRARDGVSISGKNSAITSSVSASGVGNGGKIDIQARSLLLSNGALLGTSTLGRGNAGNIQINVSDSVSLNGGSGVIAISGGQGDAGNVTIAAGGQVALDGIGNDDAPSSISTSVGATKIPGFTGGRKGGDITINAGSLALTNGAQLDSSTEGRGVAGSVRINARETVTFDGQASNGYSSGAFSRVVKGAEGDGGDIEITTGSLLLTNGGGLSANTFGQGDAGSVIIRARDIVRFDGVGSDGASSGVASTVESTGVGNGGGIDISTGSLFVTEGAVMAASTFGRGDAGSVRISARDTVRFEGVGSNGQSSGAFSTVASTGIGNGGGIDISTGSLFVTNGAQLNASTLGLGNTGSVTIRAGDTVRFEGVGSDGRFGGAFSAVSSTEGGNGGGIDITTGSLFVTEGARLITSTFGQGAAGSVTIRASDTVRFHSVGRGGTSSGAFSTVESTGIAKGGDIDITTGSLFVTDGAVVTASTFGRGNAGRVRINADNQISLEGRSGVASLVGPKAVGDGGRIEITTDSLSLTDAFISSQNLGTGIAGDITIQTTQNLELNRSSIASTTQSGNGGDMTLAVGDLLLMRNGSLISTEAGTALSGGNGGNIRINVDFVVAVPKEDSDIIANAYEGKGGNINITTQGIFGLEFREKLTPLSDITASSELGVDGEFQLDLLTNVDPSRGLAELPTNVVDASEQIDRRCTPTGSTQERSSFTVTGRGGLPASPNDPLQAESLITNWVSFDSNVETNKPPATTTPKSSGSRQLVEAQGWYFNQKGEVVLTASTHVVTPQGQWLSPPECNPAQ
ncbi:filamentous hemagglutinin N-terminal domain-containing protein [Microcoleus sp. ZQ-A2]|nr:filamentous hemagglutinin N-terminal domain-containing protein [Microcoleus sp. FACHB-1]